MAGGNALDRLELAGQKAGRWTPFPFLPMIDRSFNNSETKPSMKKGPVG